MLGMVEKKQIIVFFFLWIALPVYAGQVDRGGMGMTERNLEEMKKNNPEAYQNVLKVRQRAQRISDIVSQFRQGQMNADEARERLIPLVREDSENRLRYLDKEINQTKMRLDYLLQIKRDPNFLVDKTIENYLAPPKPPQGEVRGVPSHEPR